MRFFGLILICIASWAPCQDEKPSAQAPPFKSGDFLNALTPRSIGPTSMGGRIASIAVYEREPRIFYVASASGGLFKTENGGVTLRPVFDREGTVSLGSVAVSQRDPNVVWVGTGEGKVRNSVGWGDGVYRSADGGKTWVHLGLKDTKHISKVVLHPDDPNVAWVAAQGHVWGTNEERGVYKTIDGGKSWKRVLSIDEKTGFCDLAIDPKNPNTLLAASWERLRTAYSFSTGGQGSGLWKSTDGGQKWRRITKGLPEGPIGRIGIGYFRANPKVVLLTLERPPLGPIDALAGTEVSGGVFRSEDGGDSWKRTTLLNPRPFYFSTPVCDPTDPNRAYVLGVDMHQSDDGGRSFRAMNVPIHPDHHAMWINPRDSYHMLVGNDGGLYESRDRGATWSMLNGMAIGQYYAVAYDMRKPYYVYGGLQDNGQWTGPTQTIRGGVRAEDFYSLGGGDGFYVMPDPSDWATVYWESQGGSLNRLNQKTGDNVSIVPRPPQGERYRFNWSSPLFISPHNSSTLYFGGNRLFKSVDRGNNWKPVSPDLTTNDPAKTRPPSGSLSPESTGAETHCTIITISESPRKQGLLYVGTDDGLVHVSRDDGLTWTDITPPVSVLPKNTWCNRVVAGRFEDGTVYATFDGHRNDDYKAYAFKSEDFGKTWKLLTKGLPENECCYVIREGLRNPDLLLLGTEMSLWVSLDQGESWLRYRAGDFPTVAVHDIAIHPREMDAILATHGRSLWTIPISPLEQLTAANLQKDAFLCRPTTAYLLGRMRSSSWSSRAGFVARNTQPSATFYYYLKSDAKKDPTIEVTDAGGRPVFSRSGSRKAGLQSVSWNLQGGMFSSRVAPGDYRVTLKVDEESHTTSLKVEDLTDELQR